MAKEIDKIIQSKTAPKSNNVLWDDGENLKINRNGKWENAITPSVVNIKRSDLLKNNTKALELAKIFVDSYIGYNEELDEWEIDYEKIPHINLIIDFSALSLDEDVTSGFEKVIIKSIHHNVLLQSHDTMKVILLTLVGFSEFRISKFCITWAIPFIMTNKDIITEGSNKISTEWAWIEE